MDDAAPTPVYDRLARVARRVTAADAALVAQLDGGRVRLLGASAEGDLPGEPALEELCRSLLAAGAAPDSPASAAWRPRAEGGQERSVLGVALHTDGDAPLLAVLAPAPRRWTECERDLLSDLAALGAAADVDQMARARRVAEDANRAKNQFLAMMSHEIRTPINAVIAYVDLLGMEISGPLNDRQADYLQRIRSSAHHLTSLIGDVLDLARIEAREMHVRRERVSLHETVTEALAIAEPLIAREGLELQGPIGCDPEVHYWGDADRVRQILVNLLSNAAKFTEKGWVRVCCLRADAAPSGALVQAPGPLVGVEVADSGIGVPPELHQRIFEPFVQAEAGYTRRGGGTGLGLAISRNLARIMGGDLTVQSAPGEGSRFTLWLAAGGEESDRRTGADRRSGRERRDRE